MKIRNAQSKDINQLEIISKDRFKEKEMRLKFVNLVENNNYSVKIIEDSEDDILGFIVIKFIDMDLIEIYSLAVKKFYENRKSKNFAILGIIIFMVILFFLITILRMDVTA